MFYDKILKHSLKEKQYEKNWLNIMENEVNFLFLIFKL